MVQSDLSLTLDPQAGVPLYEQVCQQFRDGIESGRLASGTALPTNHELCDRLQIAYKTAQRAMATLAEEGYVTRAARRGTIVKGVPTRGVVGVYLFAELFDEDPRHTYYRQVTRHLTRQLEQRRRVFRLYLGSETDASDTPNTADDDLLEHITSGALRGVLLVNAFGDVAKLCAVARQRKVPIVSLIGLRGLDYSVLVDFRSYINAAATFLKENNRKRVGVIYNSRSHSFQTPRATIPTLLGQAGIAPDPSLIVGRVETEAGGYAAAKALPIEQLDGLIVQDDVMALGVDRYLREHNLGEHLLATTLWNRGSTMQLHTPFERFEFDVTQQAELGLQLLDNAMHGQRIIEPHQKLALLRTAN